MATPEPPRLPTAPFTLYPRRCFPPLPRRCHATAGDRLLRHVVAKLAPAMRPHARPRLQPDMARTGCGKRQRLSLRKAAYRWSDLLTIWRHCDECRCRRDRRCSGDPMACLPRYLPRVPQAARLWFASVGLAAERNVSFAEAVALTDREGEAACARWHAALDKALPRSGVPQRSAKKG